MQATKLPKIDQSLMYFIMNKILISSKRLKIVLITSVFFIVLLVFFYKNYYSSNETPILISDSAVVSDVIQIVQVAGTLEPKIKVDLGAQVSGQVSKINVKLGQQVKKGDLLISLDPEIARNEVAQAEAVLAQQTALIDSRQADLKFAQNELGRQRRLLASEATTVSEFEKAELDLLKLQADLRGQMANLKNLQAQLENRRLQLAFTTITAPIDGVVISLPVQVGQTVIALQSTTLLLSLANLEDMTVRARIPEAEISNVQVGQQAYFTTFAGEATRYKGIVRAIEPMPERVGNAVFYNVLFDVNNKARKLLSNMTVQVSIITGEAKGVLTIPTVALSERAEDGSYTVQVVSANNVLQSRLIQIGLQDDGKVQVKNGLKAGEKVLLAPPQSESGADASKQAK